MKNILLSATLSLGALCLAGCAKSGDAPTTVSAGSPAGNAGAKTSVVYIPKNTGNAYFDSVITGFQKAAKEKNLDFTTVAPATADATSQIPFIKQQIQRGVKAIAITPNSPDALKPVLKQARDKGIKIIAVDADLEKNEDARDAVVLPVDFSVIGRSQIELLGDLIGNQGEIAILSATTDAPNQNSWIKGMKAALQDPKFSKMKLVEIVYGDDEPQKSQRETEALLTKYPNLKGIIAPTSVGLVAAAQALETAQAAKRVQLTGLGLPNQMRRFVQNGTVKKFALWNPEKMGYAAGVLMSDLLAGNGKTDADSTIKVGEDTLKFGEKGTLVAGPPLVFDAKNIGDYKF